MIIAQISDLHFVNEGKLCYEQLATNVYVREMVSHINNLDPLPDVVIATGDLTHHGTGEEYAELDDILSALVPPLYMIPGNHDCRDIFLEAFSGEAYLPQPGAAFAHYVVGKHPVRLIGLDTTITGQGQGMICEERLTWLDTTLCSEPHQPTLIFMHHPPFRTHIRWVDALGLYGISKLEEVVRRHPQVQRIVCGHVHRSIQVSFGGTIACAAPSASFQFTLNLTEKGGFDIRNEPRAILLHMFDPKYDPVSHLSFVSVEYENYNPISALKPRGESVDEALKRIEKNYKDLFNKEFK